MKKTEGGQTILYINQYFEKNLTTGVVTTSYYLGGQLIAQRAGTTLTYIHQDSLGSTSVMSTSTGTLDSLIAYFPFGATRTGSVSTDKKFTGQRLDGTGLYYYGARYYDATIGRFISADTVIQSLYNPQTLNRYTYCVNNPLTFNDPTGNWPNWVKSFANTVKSVNWGAVLQTASQVAAIVLTTISVVAAIVDTGNVMAVESACMEYPAEVTSIEQSYSEILPAEISDLGSGLQATVEDNSATTIGREIGSYNEVKTPGFETHHLIEKRFNPQLVENGYDTA